MPAYTPDRALNGTKHAVLGAFKLDLWLPSAQCRLFQQPEVFSETRIAPVLILDTYTQQTGAMPYSLSSREGVFSATQRAGVYHGSGPYFERSSKW